MTDYALFSTVQYPANSWTLSSDRLTAVSGAAGASARLNAWIGQSLTTGRFYFQIKVNTVGGALGEALGLADTSTSLNTTSGNPPNCLLVFIDAASNPGDLYSINAGSYTMLHSFGIPNVGDSYLFCIDAGMKLAWVNYWNATASTQSGWNPQNVGANPDTNMGGISLSFISAFTPLIQAYLSTGNSVTINTGGSAYPITMPTTFGNLPPTIQINSTTIVESLLSAVVWGGDNVTQLQYQLDGGSWTNATGTVTGNGGTAFFPIINDYLIHSLQLRDSANSIDAMPPVLTFADIPGDVVLSEFGFIGGSSTTGTIALSGGGVTSLSFNTNLNYYSGTGFATYAININFLNASGQIVFSTGNVYSLGTPITWGNLWWESVNGHGVSSITGTGSLYNVAGTLTSYYSGSNVYVNFDVTVNGTVTSYSGVQAFIGTDPVITGVEILTNASLDTGEYSASVSVPPNPPETLVLSTAAASSGGTATLTGTYANAPLAYIGISDSGPSGSFTLAGSSSITGSTYSASTTNTFTPGTYPMVTQDLVTGVKSNTVTMTVAAPPPETLTITGASCVAGGPVTIYGSFENAPLELLNTSTSNGATFTPAASSLIYGVDSGTYETVTANSLSAGTYTLYTQDAVTSVISNPWPLVVTLPPEGSCCVALPSQTLGRYRGNVGINFYGLTLFGDFSSGVIGVANFGEFQEYGNTMRGLITAPSIHSDRKRIFMPRFELDIESGVGQPDCCGYDPVWMLDWSKDGGRTYGPIQQFRSMGKIGEYRQRLRWLRLGQGRQWIFRLQSTDPVRRVIIGTYADFYEGMGTSGP